MQRCTEVGLSSIFRIVPSTTPIGATKKKNKKGKLLIFGSDISIR